MQAFQYHKAASALDASHLINGKAEAKYLAGGQSLLAAMRLRLAAPSDVIDLAGAPDLAGIRMDGSNVVIGAMARHVQVETHADVRTRIPGLAALAGGIGDRQVRNVGTIGGSLANNDPAACYPAAALGLGATIITNKGAIKADDFFKGLFETALAEGELITAVSFPSPSKSAYIKFKQPASRFALVGVFVSNGPDGPRVAVTGASNHGVFRVKSMESALAKSWSPEAIRGISVDPSEMLSDLHAQGDYRAHLVGVLAARAVAAAR